MSVVQFFLVIATFIVVTNGNKQSQPSVVGFTSNFRVKHIALPPIVAGRLFNRLTLNPQTHDGINYLIAMQRLLPENNIVLPQPGRIGSLSYAAIQAWHGKKLSIIAADSGNLFSALKYDTKTREWTTSRDLEVIEITGYVGGVDNLVDRKDLKDNTPIIITATKRHGKPMMAHGRIYYKKKSLEVINHFERLSRNLDHPDDVKATNLYIGNFQNFVALCNTAYTQMSTMNNAWYSPKFLSQQTSDPQPLLPGASYRHVAATHPPLLPRRRSNNKH